MFIYNIVSIHSKSTGLNDNIDSRRKLVLVPIHTHVWVCMGCFDYPPFGVPMGDNHHSAQNWAEGRRREG